MKTKFVRYVGKLSPINQTDGPFASLENRESMPHSPHKFGEQAFRKTDSRQFYHFMSSFEEFMKKQSKQIGDFELEPRDRTVVLDLPQCDQVQGLDDDTLKEWITDVFNTVFSSAFHAMSKDAMSYEQTKIFCSEGIIRNIVLLTKKFRLSKEQIETIDDHIQECLVPYLQKKYPLTEASGVNKSVDEKVKPIDNRQAIENDMLQKSDIVFTYRQDQNYNELIMKFLNWLLIQIDVKVEIKENQKASTKNIEQNQQVQQVTNLTVYEDFYQYVSKELFQKVYDYQWMHEGQRKTSSNFHTAADKQKQRQKQSKYQEQVKHYTHFVIGRKISKNVQTFSQQEIKSGHLTIKNTAILRILTKWCEQLWAKFSTKNYFLNREQNIRVQEKDGNINTMFKWMKEPLNDLMEDEKKQIQQFMKELHENNFDQQARLFQRQLQKDGFTHIERIQKASGKFACKIVNNLHSYITIYLNRLIHGLLTVSKKLYEKHLTKSARWTSPPDLMTFTIGDIMRCKIASKQAEILKIFQTMEKISQNEPKKLKIVRVKNRLKLGTNDILINVLYRDKFLCEFQLGVNSAQTKFIKCSNLFTHYIYELGRTQFGPLTQLCSVWMSLDPRASQYSQIIKNEKKARKPEDIGCKKQGKNHDYKEINRPFICSVCQLSYSHTNFIWEHKKCQVCPHMICARCQIENFNEKQLMSKLLKDNKDIAKACTTIVNKKMQGQRLIPSYGVSILIESKQIKIQTFKKIEINKIMSIYGSEKNKDGGEKITLITELLKKGSEKQFFEKYLIFEIPEQHGKNLIKFDQKDVKKHYIIPQKIKDVYKKEQELLSLIEQGLDEEYLKKTMIKGKAGMEHVKNMELTDNKVEKIEFITQNFPNLNRLLLSRNIVAGLDSIGKLKQLQVLNVRENQLTSLPDELCTLSKLKGLNIRQNKDITKLPQQFGNLKSLKKLQSDANKIAQLPKSFKMLKNLEFIDLSKNLLTAFPDAFQNLTNLEEINLSENKFTKLPNWINNFHKLKSLNLSKVKLDSIPRTLFELKNLQVLKIQSKETVLPPEIQYLKSLRELNFKLPNLKQLPKEVSQLQNLQTIELSDCIIKQLPNYFSKMNKLTTLTLLNNQIENFPKQFNLPTNIMFLRIQGQNITHLPEEMKQLVKIRTLSLNSNKFTEIPSAIQNYTKMYEFSIIKNQIKGQVNLNIFDELKQLKEMYIDKPQLINGNEKLKKQVSIASEKQKVEKKGKKKTP